MEVDKISVCICTRNRPDELLQCLNSIASCKPLPSQVIVSDDSAFPDRQTEAVCCRYPFVSYQRGPRQGLSANRNACVRACQYDWIHFIDDDVIVDPSFYAKCSKLLPGLRRSTVVTGWEKNFGGGGPFSREIRPPRHGFWAFMGPASEADFNCVVINATVFPRSLFDRICFDEFFKYGCEESDISLHAASIGFHLVFASELWVEHYPSAANRDVYRDWLTASQVYAGLKRQWNYKHSALRTIAFTGLAVPRLLLYTLRHDGARPFLQGVWQAGRGIICFLSQAGESKTQGPLTGRSSMPSTPYSVPKGRNS